MHTESGAAGAAAGPDRDGGWPQLVTLVLTGALSVVCMLVLWPMLSHLSEEFGASVSSVAWVLIIMAVLNPGLGAAFGGLGALKGNRLMLIFAASMLLIGCIVAALSNTLMLLIIARGIQACGLAMMPLLFGIAAAHYSGQRMRLAFALIIGSTGLGGLVGYMLSGFLSEAGVDWHVLFWICTGLVAACH